MLNQHKKRTTAGSLKGKKSQQTTFVFTEEGTEERMLRSLFNHKKFLFSEKNGRSGEYIVTLHGKGLNALVTQSCGKNLCFPRCAYVFRFQILLIYI